MADNNQGSEPGSGEPGTNEPGEGPETEVDTTMVDLIINLSMKSPQILDISIP